jgi:hypothetical protein
MFEIFSIIYVCIIATTAQSFSLGGGGDATASKLPLTLLPPATTAGKLKNCLLLK